MAVGTTLLFAAGCTETSDSRRPAPLRPTAFVDVNLVPMTSESVVANQTVLIEKGRIAAIHPSNGADIPLGATVVDGRGAYLMPGLADMHMHARAGWLDGSWPVSPFALYLANGVTTVRHFGTGRPSFTKPLAWRDGIARGELAGPRMFVGALLGREPVDDVRNFIERSASEGFDFIKLYSFLSKQQFAEAIRTAKRVGVRTVGHIPFAVGLDGVLSAGMDEIAHIEELDFEFLDFDRERRLRPRQWFKHLTELGARQTAPYQGADGIDIERFDKIYGGSVAAVMDKLRAANVPVATTLVVGETIVKNSGTGKRTWPGPRTGTSLPPIGWDSTRAGRSICVSSRATNGSLAPSTSSKWRS